MSNLCKTRLSKEVVVRRVVMRTVMAAGPITALCVASALHAYVYQFESVVDTNSNAPTGKFSDFGIPSISRGTPAFVGAYPGGEGVFAGLNLIAKSGASAGNNGVFVDFGSQPAISSDGQVVFMGRASYSGGAPQPGFFVNSTRIANGSITSVFGNPSFSSSMTAFRTDSGDFHVVHTADMSVTPNSYAVISTTGSPAPIGTVTSLGDPAISEDGGPGGAVHVAFRANYGTQQSMIRNLSVGPGQYVDEALVLTGDPAPAGTFTSFGDPSVSRQQVAFRGNFTGGSGIFLASTSDGTRSEIASTLPFFTFTGFGDPSVSTIGQTSVAFLGNVGGAKLLMRWLPHGLFTVLGTGQELFGSTVTDIEFGRFGLDPGYIGTLAFGYSLANGRSGIARAFPNSTDGDFNIDGIVDALDLLQWKFFDGVSEGADADRDVDTDGNDFLIWQRNISKLPTEVPASREVPEPRAVNFGMLVFVALVLGELCHRFRQLPN